MNLLVLARNAKSGLVLGAEEVGAPIMAYGYAPILRGGPSAWRIRLRISSAAWSCTCIRCWAWPGAWCSVACLELGGGKSGSDAGVRGPGTASLPNETRMAKEAKGTHAPRGKLL